MIVATPSESAFFKKTQIWRFLCEEKRQSIVLTMERLVGDKGLKKKSHKRGRGGPPPQAGRSRGGCGYGGKRSDLTLQSRRQSEAVGGLRWDTGLGRRDSGGVVWMPGWDRGKGTGRPARKA